MAIIKKLNGKSPKTGKDCYLSETAVLVGEVELGEECSVWYNAVLRGDVNSIHVGDRTNIQDGAVVHGTYRKAPVKIGNDVSIAHHATVHGCTIGDGVLIGMNATVMDHAEVGRGAVIAAGSVVTERAKVPSGTIWAGVPARQVKKSGAGTVNSPGRKTARNYLMYKSWYEKGEKKKK
jgi:carbonic anhydrase/acetyltransferase-like protein (isoleucine patch superfamily)